MSGNVVDIREAKGHIFGPMVCTGCEHEWDAYRDIGETTLTCPACQRELGLPKGEALPEVYWECHCGSNLFFITEYGPTCRMCGVIPSCAQEDWDE